MHCLNLKVTYDCTNQCSFCFSSYMKGLPISFENMKSAVLQGRENGCNELVLSGGEPTLFPEYIIELISIAITAGYEKFIVQTNGYGLSKNAELVSFLDDATEKAEVCISFSVHGDSAETHNKISGNPVAFETLIDAIRKISETQCLIYTNTVINALNINHLADISNLILRYKPTIMQFSMMHLAEKSEISVSLAESVSAIRKLRGILNLDILKTEGIPYCLLYGMEQCVGESSWPSVLDLYNKDDDYMRDFKQLNYGMRMKMKQCKNCIFNGICMGVWTENYEEFLKMRIHPIN